MTSQAQTSGQAATSCEEIYQDLWFSFVVPDNGEAIVNTIIYDLFPRFEVYEGICGSLSFLACGYNRQVRISDRAAGEELYVRVYSSSMKQGEFSICILPVEDHTNDICEDAIILEVSSSCSNNIYSTHLATAEEYPTTNSSCDPSTNTTRDIWFNVTIPASGSVAVFVEDGTNTNLQIVMEAFKGSCTSLTHVDCAYGNIYSGTLLNLFDLPEEEYFIRVSRSNGSSPFNVFRICAQTIENDLCADAIPLTVDGSCSLYSNIGTSPSHTPQSRFACGDSTALNDLWFSAVVPSSGNLTVETQMVDGGISDMIMEAFVGECSGLTYLACNDHKEMSDGFDAHSFIGLENQIPGSTIYFRIAARYNYYVGEFEVCARDEGYSYPCRITLVEILDQSMCDPLTNTFSQDLLVHYRDNNLGNGIQVNNIFFKPLAVLN